MNNLGPRTSVAVRWTLAAIALSASVAVSWTSESGRIRELNQLPDAERHALMERALATLTDVCPEAQGTSLEHLCADQARLVRRLDECDGSCREFASQFLPQPRR